MRASYIESGCIVLAGLASAVALYEWWKHKTRAGSGTGAPQGFVQTTQAAAFMGGLFGSPPPVTSVELTQPGQVVFI